MQFYRIKGLQSSILSGASCAVVLASATMSLAPSAAYSQADSGRVVGTVVDSTGAAVPNASITLLNKTTALKLTGRSNANGELNIPAVPAGDYTATVAATGFQTQVQSLTIQVTTTQTLEFSREHDRRGYRRRASCEYDRPDPGRDDRRAADHRTAA